MAGTGARDIKQKIKSVNSTLQITKAMELVSTAKLKTNRDRFDTTKPFFNKTVETILDIFEKEKNLKHPVIQDREVNNTLIIVITSDRGLCGGYNVNVMREVEDFAKTCKGLKLITIGKKSTDYFSHRAYDIVKSFEGVSEKPQKEHSKIISEKAYEMFVSGEVDEVRLFSTSMVSTISQVPKMSRLLPFDFDSIKDSTKLEETDDFTVKEPKDLTTYSPSPTAVLNMIVPMYLNSYVLGALIESSCAEQAARRNAMENASDNAKDMIDSLSLSYNQARQAAITQELTEIVAGASAL